MDSVTSPQIFIKGIMNLPSSIQRLEWLTSKTSQRVSRPTRSSPAANPVLHKGAAFILDERDVCRTITE